MKPSHSNPSFSRALAIIAVMAIVFYPFVSQGQTSGSSYPGPVYQQPPPASQGGGQGQGGGKLQALSQKVAQIAANDQRQDSRLNHLERDADKLHSSSAPKPPPSVESGLALAPAMIPYVPYQVRKGDTLWRIAMNHRVAPGDIINFNRMPNETVVPGQTLMIPQKNAAPKPGVPAAAGFHTVKPGESYGSISRKYGVTSEALAKANPKINPEKLQAGARLALPSGAKMPAPKPVPPPSSLAYDNGLPAAPTKASPGFHIVQPGESLSVIAQRYHMTTAALQKANGMSDPNTLRVGQKLTVPGGAGIAATSPHAKTPAKSKPPPNKVLSAGNGLTAAPEYPTPPEKPKAPTPPTPPPAVSKNRAIVAYRMERGDTIEKVAQTFGTTTAEIRRLNKLDTSTRLREGDEILVPGMGPVVSN